MEEKNIHSMTYGEILDYCEKLQEKWCTDANRKYCSILQAGRCPKQFSKEKDCDSLSHHFENNNWCGELEEGRWFWNKEEGRWFWNKDGEILTSWDGMNWTKRSSYKDNDWTELSHKEADWYVVEYKKNPVTNESWDNSMLLGNEKGDSFLINNDVLNESNWFIRYEKYDNGSIDTFDCNTTDLHILIDEIFYKDKCDLVITPEEIRESFSKALERGFGSNVANWDTERIEKIIEIIERQIKRKSESFFTPYIPPIIYKREEKPEPRLVFDFRYDFRPVPQFIDFTIDVKGLDEE